MRIHLISSFNRTTILDAMTMFQVLNKCVTYMYVVSVQYVTICWILHQWIFDISFLLNEYLLYKSDKLLILGAKVSSD